MKISVPLCLVFYLFLLLHVNIIDASDLTKQNVIQMNKNIKYSKVKIHLHRNILQYLEFDSPHTYRYIRQIIQWNPLGFFARDSSSLSRGHQFLTNATDDELTLIQHFVLLDFLYNHNAISAPDKNQIQAWFRFYSPSSLQITPDIITFSYLYLPWFDRYGHIANQFFFNKFWNGTARLTEHSDFELLSMTYNYHTRVLTFPNRHHLDLTFSKIPFSTIFIPTDVSENSTPAKMKRIFDLELINYGRIYTEEGWFLQFGTTIYEQKMLLLFEFSQYINSPATCKAIRIHIRYESPDQSEQLHIDFGYRRWYDFSAARKCTADIQRYFFNTLSYEFFQVDQCSFRLHHVSEDQIKNKDYLSPKMDNIIELLINQFIYVQYF